MTRPGQTRWSCSHSQVLPEAAFPTRWNCPCSSLLVNTRDNSSASKCDLANSSPIPTKTIRRIRKLPHVSHHVSRSPHLLPRNRYNSSLTICIRMWEKEVVVNSPSRKTIATLDSHPALPWFSTRRRRLSRGTG